MAKQPSPDFEIDYDHDAVERIIELTNGQPYLAQLICRELVTNFNRQFFEEGREREKRFTVEDVEEIINAPDFYSDGNAYFTGIWMQAENSLPARQQEILRKLCSEELSQEQLAEKTNFSLSEVGKALEILLEHDVIRERNGCYGYTVELMRRWVEALR